MTIPCRWLCVRRVGALCAALTASTATAACLAGPVPVTTQANDNARTGANLSETLLTPKNVTAATFGKLFTLNLDANVNGQVLYVPNLTINGAAHNVIFAYTSNNSNGSPCGVWAFDADDAAQTSALWHYTLPTSAQWTTDTPVIDPATNTMYLVSKSTNDGGPTYLRAIDIATSNEKPGSPIQIAAIVSGTGDGSSGGKVSFDSSHANERPGLLLLNGRIYIAFAHNSDSFPYHGWIFGYSYDGSAFTQTGVFCSSPNGGLDGIWQAGKGLAADDAGNIYCSVGNGAFTANSGGTGYGMCYIKLSTPDLAVQDWFAPFDEAGLSSSDLDTGNSGVLVIPGTSRLFGGGTKYGAAFVLNTDNLGRFTPGGPDKVIDRINGISGSDKVGQNPVCWDKGTEKYLYLWPSGSPVEQFRFDSTYQKLIPKGVFEKFTGNTAGGQLAVSANGASAGILWAQGYDNVLHAFRASNVSLAELWNSNMNSSRDGLGTIGHWQFPTIVNGKVYIGDGRGHIVVYGLLSPRAAAP